MKNSIDRAEKVLDSIHDWIKSADQKVSIFLAFIGIVLNLFLPKYSDAIILRFKFHTLSSHIIVLAIMAILFLLIALFKSLESIFPKLGNKNNKQILYFGSIETFQLNRYKIEFKAMSKNDYLNQLLEQIHINSKIASGKHAAFKKSLIFFILSMIFFAISGALLNFS